MALVTEQAFGFGESVDHQRRAVEQISIASTASEGAVDYQDFEQRPLSRVGELAENEPGTARKVT